MSTMTTTHTEYLDDVTAGIPVVPCPWCDPQEDTRSEAEAEPLATVRELRPIVERTEKWRLYKTELYKGKHVWFALQPADLTQSYFRNGVGCVKNTYDQALYELQLAMAKAAA